MANHQEILIVGFGSQAQAWAHCLFQSGYKVTIALRNLDSASARLASLYSVVCLESNEALNRAATGLVAFLIHDGEIGNCYTQYFRGIETPQTFVLAHGFAKYSGQLQTLSPLHEFALFAPKAIGPKIRESFDRAGKDHTHALRAAVCVTDATRGAVLALSQGLGFDSNNWIETSFEKETLGDLISEQGLLCGTLFTALIETANEMHRAGIPGPLIREECITELELIASMLNQYGPHRTYSKISQAAQAGSALMAVKLKEMPLRQALALQAEEDRNGVFVKAVEEQTWKPAAKILESQLENLEVLFRKTGE